MPLKSRRPRSIINTLQLIKQRRSPSFSTTNLAGVVNYGISDEGSRDGSFVVTKIEEHPPGLAASSSSQMVRAGADLNQQWAVKHHDLQIATKARAIHAPPHAADSSIGILSIDPRD